MGFGEIGPEPVFDVTDEPAKDEGTDAAIYIMAIAMISVISTVVVLLVIARRRSRAAKPLSGIEEGFDQHRRPRVPPRLGGRRTTRLAGNLDAGIDDESEGEGYEFLAKIGGIRASGEFDQPARANHARNSRQFNAAGARCSPQKQRNHAALRTRTQPASLPSGVVTAEFPDEEGCERTEGRVFDWPAW